jgi:hypothetical protein
MSAWETHEANDDGLSAEERVQLRELCVLIVISEFWKPSERLHTHNPTSKITRVK